MGWRSPGFGELDAVASLLGRLLRRERGGGRVPVNSTQGRPSWGGYCVENEDGGGGGDRGRRLGDQGRVQPKSC